MKFKRYILFFTCLLSTSGFTNLLAQYDEICNAIFLNPRCTNYGYYTFDNTYATNSPQAAPTCGNYQGADLWFKTIVPNSGKLQITTKEGGVLDGAMAAYRASSCTGALTEIACDDDSGPNFMPQIDLTGLTIGDSIFIRFWEPENDWRGWFELAVYDPNPDYCMVGDATMNFPSNCIQLTKANVADISSVWSNAKLNLAAAFDYNFQVYLGTNDATGADGVAFVLQNNAMGTTAAGTPGASLGVGGLDNSLIIEFDTFDNGTAVDDIAADHIAISLNGDLTNAVSGPIRAVANPFASNNIENGTYHTVRITWDPGSMTFSVYFGGILRLTYTNDIVNNVFDGDPMVYWGFSGCIGFYSNDQIICPGTLPLPVEWSNFEAYVKAGQVWIEWSTYSESNTDEFIIERSSDGTLFTEIGNIPAAGNSSSLLSYRFTDRDPLPGISYYRLKQTDLDNAYSYSKIEAVEFDLNGLNFEMYPNPVQNSEEITVEFNFGAEGTEVELLLLNNLGQVISNTHLTKGKNKVTLPVELPPGIYHAILKTESGIQSKKLVIENY